MKQALRWMRLRGELALAGLRARRDRSPCLPPERQPSVEVVVCSLDTLHPLRLTLATLRRRTAYSNYRLLVIDNASTDGSLEYLRARAARGEWVLQEAARQPHAHWVEERFRFSDAEFVVFVDSDLCFFAGDWLSDIVSAFLANPRVVVVSGEARHRREGVVEPVGGELVDMAEAPCTWLFGLRTDVRDALPTGFGFVHGDPDPVTGRRTVYDTGAAFLRDALASGWEHGILPPSFSRKWRHWESLSWFAEAVTDPDYLRAKRLQLREIERLADRADPEGRVSRRSRSTPPAAG